MDKIIINLNNHNKETEVLKLSYTRNVKTSRPLSYQCHKIEIVPKNDSISNFNNVFKIRCGSREVSSSIENIDVNKEGKLDFEILCNPHKIPQNETDELRIKCDLKLQFTRNTKDTVTNTILFEIIKENAKPVFKIAVGDEFVKGYVYEEQIVEFGSFIITNDSVYEFAYPLDITNLEFVLEDEQGNPIKDRNGNPGKDIIKVKALSNGNNAVDNANIYRKIQPKKSCGTFILQIDLTKIKHPKTDTKFIVSIKGQNKVNNANYSNIDSKKQPFIIKTNTKKTELVVEYRDGTWSRNSEKEINSDELISISNKQYNLQSQRDSCEILTGSIRNRATIQNNNNIFTGLKIKNIEFDIVTESEHCNPFSGMDKSIKDIIYCEIKPPNTTKWIRVIKYNEEIQLPNTLGSIIYFKIAFIDKGFDCLSGTKENKMQLLAIIRFNVWAIPEIGEPKKEYKTYKFQFELKQYEGDNWLALDFGTSAIVTKYGKTIIDLQEINKLSYTDSYEKDNIEEFGTPFLSSTILFEKDNLDGLCQENGSVTDTIRLSPSVSKIREDYQYLSPYIKSLIGYKMLPAFNNILKELENKNKYLYINNVIKAAYETLLKKFLLSKIDNANIETNKIIISIPNVFTSRQKEIIKNAVLCVIPNIWKDYILFISESDAIACYYYFNRHTMDEPNSDGNTTVLVYDMGAGTLDLTLFHISNNRELKILGKVGLTTAGNYLDTVLAEITFKQLKDNNIINIENGFHPVDNFDGFINEVIPYKYFIKNILKPALSDNQTSDEVVVSFQNVKVKNASDTKLRLSHIDLETIRNSKEYNQYLNSVTQEALELLQMNMIEPDPELSINRLIVSGRGSQIFGLENKLTESLKKVFKSNPAKISIDSNKMKSIVAEGAIEYVRFRTGLTNNRFISNSVYARIGVLVIRAHNKEYKELISQNHNFRLANTNIFTTDQKGYEIKYSIKLLEEVREITLIQTFWTEKKVITQLNNGELYNTSSVIAEFGRDIIREGDGELNLFICKDGEIFVQFCGDIMAVNPTIDITNSRSFKKSMWPIIK
jgi:hypothetical protein